MTIHLHHRQFSLLIATITKWSVLSILSILKKYESCRNLAYITRHFQMVNKGLHGYIGNSLPQDAQHESHPQKVHFPVAKPSTTLLLLPYASDDNFTKSRFHVIPREPLFCSIAPVSAPCPRFCLGSP